MINIPDKIYDRNINDVEIGLSEIHLYSKEEIKEAQLGYSVNSDGNKITDWLGDNYVVIGNDSCCGDPIITDIFNEKLPVYIMFHDDWDSLRQIADNFELYIDILNKIDSTDLSREIEKNRLISNIKAMSLTEDEEDYWNSMIEFAYEFLNGL